MERLRLAVIGVGHLGKEHARILAGLPGVELAGVADARAEQAEAVARRWSTWPFTDHRRLLDERPDAAVIAVPTIHHHAVAVDCLRAGISLLVEKPLAASLDEADELVALAQRAGVVLQVGHIERFNPAFEDLARRPLRPKLVHCQRFSPFSGRSLDIGVVLDLMIHDLDLLLALVRAPVRDVAALGLSLLGGHEDLAQARITFENGCVAHLSASRVHTGPVRRMEVWAPEGFAAVDFHRRRLSLIQPSVQLRQLRMRPRPLDEATLAALRSDLFGRYLHEVEVDCAEDRPDQLTRELTEFVATVRSGAPIRVPGEQGREALALACRILESLRGHAWDGRAEGPTGPSSLPPGRGALFSTLEPDVAA
jgi:predicted dehydrogenase